MTRVLRAEILKLRTAPMAWVPLLAVLPGVLIAWDVADAPGRVLSADDLPRVVAAPNVVLAFLALLTGVLFATSEWRHRSVVDTFLRTPRRERVVAAKVAVAALNGVAVAAAGTLAATVTGWTMIAGVGVTPELGGMPRVLAGVLLSGALYAAFGAALGLLLRSQASAIVVALLWRSGLESLVMVRLGLKDAVDWLPHALGMTVETSGHGPTGLGLAAAAALFTAYVVALGAGAALRTIRGDVTA